MTSGGGHDTSSVLSGSISTSPRTIRGNSEHSHSPVRHRTSVGDENDINSRPRLSPTLTRSYNPNDPDVRERQRTMDVDMALHLSRARSGTVVGQSPDITTPSQGRPELSLADESFIGLSRQEERDLDFAKGVGVPVDHDEQQEHFHPGPASDVHLNHLSSGHDPSLLVSLGGPDPDDTGGLPMYQPSLPVEEPTFDFGALETFAKEEKNVLGIHSPMSSSPPDVQLSSSQVTSSTIPAPSENPPNDFTLPLPRARQRKLSQSTPGPRRAKMALFENNPGGPPPSLAFRSQLGSNGAVLSAVPSFDNLPQPSSSNGAPGLPRQNTTSSGHDRPYRFSFYSNALSATIHAKSLSELPADGQTFEQLFHGISQSKNRSDAFNPSRPNTSMGMNQRMNAASSIPIPGQSGLSKMAERRFTPGGANQKVPGASADTDTWWLDIQSPTDEEMKVLSKVFSIHPLTTEDIQMEETREKIELFRNYYFISFRSFEQDNLSPTYLEPLNMYIIVFREGILSFHFRPTPHPQNVRRRIKQLKDYISVTSDWISYALIDDITDAFGPLIQGIEYEVDSIDELVLILKEAEQSDMLRRIGTCRKKVMGLLRLMGNKADVVKGLAKRCNENWRVAPTSDIGLYLSDIQDHLITMTQNLNHYEKILSRSHSNYLAQISIEMTDANNQINDVLSKLTALGTVLIPMNLVTGLWGMNVNVPGQDVPGYAWFFSIIAVLAAFAVIAGWSTYKLMVAR
ncbi:cora-domain-containing protein [Trametopsis cervina]|nr:cora-domain-containing protein [Trametopsis cervina]